MHPHTPVDPDPDDLNARGDVVIVNYNGADELATSLERWETFREQGYLNEIIVVDNDSTDQSKQVVEDRFPKVVWVGNDDNLGWGRAVNVGMEHANSPYVFVSNPDMLVEECWCYGLLQAIDELDEVGVATGVVLRPSGEVDGRGAHLTWRFNSQVASPSDEVVPVDSARGSALMVDREALLEVDGIAEDLFLQWEEADLTLKLRRAGYDTIFVPGCLAWHCEKSSRDVPLRYYHARNMYLVAGRHLSFTPYARILVVNLLLHTVVTWLLALIGERSPSSAWETTRGGVVGALRSLSEQIL